MLLCYCYGVFRQFESESAKYTIVGHYDVIACIVTVVWDSGLFAAKPLVIVCLLAAIGTDGA